MNHLIKYETQYNTNLKILFELLCRIKNNYAHINQIQIYSHIHKK